MREIGIHIRLDGSLQKAVDKALRLGIDTFQFFVLLQESNKIIAPKLDEIKKFRECRALNFHNLYVHGSYWINPAGIDNNGMQAFNREYACAKKLDIHRMLLHCGSAKGAEIRDKGIDAVASFINKILIKEPDIELILENTAHGNMSVGSDLHDFVRIREKITHPERIQYCLDTAHAYAYGYDIADEKGFDAFMHLLDETIGFQSIALIHLNDTRRVCGSKIDQHEIPGQGRLGMAVLKKIIHYPALSHVPLILELPIIPEDQEQGIIDEVRLWHTNESAEVL